MPVRTTLLLAGLLMLAACATPVHRAPEATDWTVHRDQLAHYNRWTASGKLALRTSDRSESAQMVWRQEEDLSHLNLSGPMGLNATEVSSDGRRIDIVQGEDRRSFDISSPGALKRHIGWDVPVQSLPYWLRGLPSPHLEVESLELDAKQGRLSTVVQDSWQVHYQQYEQFGSYTLPTRLRIEQGDTLVKILLRDWQAGVTP